MAEASQTAVKLLSHSTVLLVESVSRAVDYYRDKLGFAVDLNDTLPEHYGCCSTRRGEVERLWARWVPGSSELPN